MSAGQQAQLRARAAELVAERPEHDEMHQLVLEAWHALDSCRSIGFAVGPIPITAIYAWCDRQPVLDEELSTLVIGAINYLDAERSRAQAAKSEAKTPPTRGPRSAR